MAKTSPKKKKELKQTVKARTVLKYTREATTAFREQCDASRTARRASGGATTHAEQDLLRAMLVFAAAGLDSLLKHLIRDCLRDLADKDLGVQAELETFVLRSLRGDTDSAAAAGRKFLAKALVAPLPLYRVTEEYVRELTGDSLQSAEQVIRAAKALGLDPAQLDVDTATLRDVFEARNQIIHELDIKLEVAAAGARKRRSRTIDEMTERVDYLLTIGDAIITGVENKLRSRRRITTR